ncbi:MAG: secondary thiamine-phosphate synthase enzyme YjbQ [Deltaproteobacteria bacterium]|nr:secondary thiamine-phosphate synthase enzyme YjbQ [Deltaproteobacteria bacterium]
MHHQEEFVVSTTGQGLYAVTRQVQAIAARAGVDIGLATVFVRHTSASLIINENADPDVPRDLQAFFERLVPEGDPLYLHTAEGPDDMPAHVKSALTATTLGIPITAGRAALGTWQGVYLWEHRRARHERRVIVHVSGSR